MDNVNNFTHKLNTISAKNFSSIGNINFYVGNYSAKVKEVLTRLIPFGKAVLFCTQNKFVNLGAILIENLKNENIKIIPFIEDSAPEYNKFVSSLPEDARAIITIGKDYSNLANKIATEKNLFSVSIVDSFDYSSILDYSVVEEVNGKRENFIFDADRHVIFDLEKIFLDQDNLSIEYAFIMSKLIALIDYRIYGLIVNLPTNKSAYELVKNAVEETYSIFSHTREEYLEIILKNGVLIRLANIISKGKLLSNSSVDRVVSIVGDDSIAISTAQRIIQLYTLCFSSKFDGVDIPDYLERVDRVLEYECAKEWQISGWIIEQSRLFEKRKEVIRIIKDSLKREIFGYNKVFSKVEKTYIALGGKLKEYNDKVIKMSGDFFETFNGITLSRECGITEIL
ncbi:MAG: hypothetical protein IJW43_02580 [Clostridia bacterium]|nr:hypothetical protein [Clostridia bacterium]